MLETLLSGKNLIAGNVDYGSFVKAVSGFTDIGPTVRPNGTEGYCRTTMTSPSGNMWGTPWGNRFTYDSVMGRVAQHCFPTIDLLNENVTGKRIVVFKLHYLGSNPSYVSLSRNGYASYTYGTFNGSQALDFLYFDSTVGKVMRVNPLGMSVPIAWDGQFI